MCINVLVFLSVETGDLAIQLNHAFRKFGQILGLLLHFALVVSFDVADFLRYRS